MKLIYWISTSLIALFLLWSSYSYMFSKATIDGVRDLGFPDFFRIQLAILKILAIVILIIPQVPLPIKEWGYAGIGLFFITAIVAHIAHKDSIFISLINIVFIGLLILSHMYLHKILKM
ncbi:DoxX family protein [uncultured Aquimarina sp.]|uniref:DoxX family protein n=1 Tax=uncultured Aquimarina sp. TaxID=575652 RepID=UPI0026330254|nr:DoxX family protein [uncultured Aquimarina sp.]